MRLPPSKVRVRGVLERAFGTTMFLRRVEQGLTQGEAAAAAGISQATWCRLENGVGGFTIGALQRVARALKSQLVLTLAERTTEGE